MGFAIKRPGHGRKNYAIIGPSGIIHDPRIENVNKDLHSGVANDLLEMRMKLIRDDYKFATRQQELISIDNNQLVEACYRYRIARKTRTRIVDPRTIKYYLLAGARAAGELNIRTATMEDLGMKLQKVPTPAYRLTVLGLNALLKFAHQTFTFEAPLPPRPPEIMYIELGSFLEKVKLCSPINQTILKVLFGTGARYGEAFAFRYLGNAVQINSQIRSGGLEGPTKNKRPRVSLILPESELEQSVREWVLIEDRKPLRDKLYKKASLDCHTHLGLRIHDLRHSYAIRRAQCGASTQEIADSIGDTVEVCKRHYIRFCLTDSEIDSAKARYLEVQKNLKK